MGGSYSERAVDRDIGSPEIWLFNLPEDAY